MKTRKSEIGEICIGSMQEDFKDNEKLALSYLEGKFGIEVTENIKEAVRSQLINSNYEKR